MKKFINSWPLIASLVLLGVFLGGASLTKVEAAYKYLDVYSGGTVWSIRKNFPSNPRVDIRETVGKSINNTDGLNLKPGNNNIEQMYRYQVKPVFACGGKDSRIFYKNDTLFGLDLKKKKRVKVTDEDHSDLNDNSWIYCQTKMCAWPLPTELDKSDNKLLRVSKYTKVNLPIPGLTDDIGCIKDVNGDGQGDLEDYILSIFKFSVGLAAVLALVMVMVAGLMWIMAAGREELIGKAKLLLTNSLVGLFLALTSVSILQFINPRLVNINLPDADFIKYREIKSKFKMCRSFTDVWETPSSKKQKYKDYLKESYSQSPRPKSTCGDVFDTDLGWRCISFYCKEDKNPFCIKDNGGNYKCVGSPPNNDYTSHTGMLRFLCLNNCSPESDNKTWGNYRCKYVEYQDPQNDWGDGYCELRSKGGTVWATNKHIDLRREESGAALEEEIKSWTRNKN